MPNCSDCASQSRLRFIAEAGATCRLSYRMISEEKPMPTYKYEAMDTSGGEVKDSVEAMSEDEAQQKIRQMGYFVTKITEEAGSAKKGKARRPANARSGQTFTIGGVSSKVLCTFTRQFSTLQDAGLPVLRSLRILEGQMKPGVLKNALIDVVEDVESGSTLSRGVRQASQVLRSPLRQHGQGRRGRRRPRSHSQAPGRLQGEGAEPQTQDHRRHGLPRGGHPHGGRHLDLHHVVHHSEVREDLQRLQHEAAGPDARR